MLLSMMRDALYVPLKVIVLPALNASVCGGGVMYPATAPNVIVYVPGGALKTVQLVPLPG